MANTASARKAHRQTIKKTANNLDKRKKIEFLLRKIEAALKNKDAAEVEKLFQGLQQAMDKAAKAKVIMPNKAARLKSRLYKRLSSAK
ncbi:MAG: 30S ribosomal protein S20 [Patescibacteria group bacterium]|jgi:small subunit ribosomal protein S20